MRNRVLLLALTSVLMSLCIPAIAQQPQADSTVRLIDLTADIIANVKAYVPGPMKIQKNTARCGICQRRKDDYKNRQGGNY